MEYFIHTTLIINGCAFITYYLDDLIYEDKYHMKAVMAITGIIFLIPFTY